MTKAWRRFLVVLLAGLLAAPVRAAPLPAAEAVRTAMQRVADWQLAHAGDYAVIAEPRPGITDSRDWQQAVFWIGLTEFAARDSAPRYRQAILKLGKALHWTLGKRIYHADDHTIGQAWLWAAAHGAGTAALAPLRTRFDAILAAPPAGDLVFPETGEALCQKRWCWSDALFMAPPAWYGLSKATGDPRYAAYADHELAATIDALYSADDALFFRDSRYLHARDAKGRKLFWSRGNAWVLEGLARSLDRMPADDPMRGRVETLFRTMAQRVIALQRPDGYWAPSLLEGTEGPPETSGTGLFVAALAWGTRAGLLDPAVTTEPLARGWAALDRAVHPDGMLGWVQQVGDKPDDVHAGDTQFYGAGAFLLAGSALIDLDAAGRRN